VHFGSGKSAYSVIEMLNDKSGRKTYSNIQTKGIPNVYHIKPEDVVSKEEDEKGKRKFELNIDFWMSQKKPLNILWDEIHLSFGNSRMAMSKGNLILSRFIAMGRRITGMDSRGYGVFTFVAQTERTIDVNIRELTSDIIYLKSHWFIDCHKCGYSLITNSEAPAIQKCPCGSWEIEKRDVQIEVRKFQTWDSYFNFRLGIKGKWHYARYMITGINQYYKYYDTLQYKNMWSEYLSD
jgi:hypothetical protein